MLIVGWKRECRKKGKWQSMVLRRFRHECASSFLSKAVAHPFRDENVICVINSYDAVTNIVLYLTNF